MKNRIENPELIEAYRTMPCLCAASHSCIGSVVAHHMITVARNGPDEHWNLMPLCFHHHRQAHDIPFRDFVDAHDLSWYMSKKGWDFNGYTDRWYNQDWNEREADGKKIYTHRNLG